jgi:hypothetical protein
MIGGCSKQSTEPVPSNPLIGKWDISKMTTIYQGKTEITDNEAMDQMGIIWIYVFKENNTMELTTNLCGSLVKLSGKWSTSGDKLTMIQIGPSGKSATLGYIYSIQDDVLKLNWQIPAGTEYFAEFTKQ